MSAEARAQGLTGILLEGLHQFCYSQTFIS